MSRTSKPKSLPRAKGLVVQVTRNGFGIVTTKAFAPGETCFKVTGRLIHGDLMVPGASRISDNDRNNTFRYSKTHYISPKGRLGDFLNHSCEPNGMVKKSGRRLFVVALRPISPKMEVTVDYSTLLADDDIWEMACNCATGTCRGTIGQFSSLPKAIRTKYRSSKAVPRYVAPMPRKKRRQPEKA